jgi:hypothetical protein
MVEIRQKKTLPFSKVVPSFCGTLATRNEATNDEKLGEFISERSLQCIIVNLEI